jgi:hypothetical protein
MSEALPLLVFAAAIIAVIASVAAVLAFTAYRRAASARANLTAKVDGLEARFRGVVDAETERARVLGALETERGRTQAAINLLNVEQVRARDQLDLIRAEVERTQATLRALDEDLHLQEIAFYRPRYDFAESSRYQDALDQVRELQKRLVRDKRAAIGRVDWYVNNSRTEGRKQINQTLKLMLRAFNGECDAAIAKVRYNNVHVMEARIRKACEAINAAAEVQQCEVTYEYLDLKLRELFLVHEYQEKQQSEKEEQRRIREQMREEEIALREIERARAEAERDEKRYADALERARDEVEQAEGAKRAKLLGQIASLETRLAEAHANKERAIARAQMTRSGHVYVISNIGSFGENVYKIGMTRRLDPMERVRELGDASVPFQFDVHAIIYSEDAPALEATLHRHFTNRRVNLVNERKEFFRTSIDEITAVVRRHRGDIELTRAAEAKEYRQTLALAAERTPAAAAAARRISA